MEKANIKERLWKIFYILKNHKKINYYAFYLLNWSIRFALNYIQKYQYMKARIGNILILIIILILLKLQILINIINIYNKN